jgi:N-acetyl-anhydromuramyl-L-alanine amidase AmpD
VSGVRDISADGVTMRAGQIGAVQGFVFHHTGGGGSVQGVINTLNQRHLGVQYVMDRDGAIYRVMPEGAKAFHILPSEINDLSNTNTEGMEIIAANDADVTPAQVAAGVAFSKKYKQQHPDVEFFGHGMLNPSHKQATEGYTVTQAVREALNKPKAPELTPEEEKQRHQSVYESGPFRSYKQIQEERAKAAGAVKPDEVKIDNRSDHDAEWKLAHGVNALGGI